VLIYNDAKIIEIGHFDFFDRLSRKGNFSPSCLNHNIGDKRDKEDDPAIPVHMSDLGDCLQEFRTEEGLQK
jgi:hypothetical protein